VEELKIPEGINYECTGCGKCCGGWAVPMTDADYERVSRHDWAVIKPDKFAGKSLYRPLKDYEAAGTQNTWAIRPGDDDRCPFLVDNLCFIHSQFGAEEKPSICQLFPYCFNETPSGVYVTVSFNSMAVVWNSGKSLVEQKELLERKWGEFQRLYPGHHPNWSRLQLTVGQPITWAEYLEHEAQLLSLLKDGTVPVQERLLKGSDYLLSRLPTARPAGSSAVAQKMKRMDRHLLVALHKLYFPAKKLKRDNFHFNIGLFLYQLAFQRTRIALPGRSFSFEELHAFPWPVDDPEIEDLLYRYFFSRIFGKLYFAAGFGQLSLISGFHHLILVLALIKLQAKAWALSREAPQVSLADLVPTIRQLEKGLGESALGGYEAAVWELLMFSPARVRRVLASV